jgi:Cys-tRNA(Pro)/Cys-tRNA(Cys) deacylase
VSKAPEKTLGMRALDREGIPYTPYYYPESIHDALGVAEHCGLPPEQVFKTLVVEVPDPGGRQRPRHVLVLVPGGFSLDLKQAAAGLGAKRVTMARQETAEHVTGLNVGGISALGLLGKGFGVYLDERAQEFEEIVVSAGRRGINLRMRREDFIRLTGARWIRASVSSAI